MPPRRRTLSKFCIVAIFACLFSVDLLADKGGLDSGGGTNLLREFLLIARQDIYPWLAHNERSSQPIGVSSAAFLLKLEELAKAEKIKVLPNVYVSCKVVGKGVVATMRPQGSADSEVAACFDGSVIFISEQMWPGRNKSGIPEQLLLALHGDKVGIVAHEVFRAMNIGEGDDYRYSTQIPTRPFVLAPEATITANILRALGSKYCSGEKLETCLNLRLRELPGIKLREIGGIKNINYYFDDVINIDVRRASFNLVAAKKIARRGIPLLVALKNIKVSAVTSEDKQDDYNRIKPFYVHYGRPSPNCTLTLPHWAGIEPIRNKGDVLIRAGEVFAIENFQLQQGTLLTFISMKLKIAGREPLELRCPENLINPDSTAQDVELALGGALRLFP